MRISKLLLIFFLALHAASSGVAAAAGGERWDRNSALASAAEFPVDERVADWLTLARSGAGTELLARLRSFSNDRSWSAPARDKALHGLAVALGDLDPGSVDGAVLDFLQGRQALTEVPHPDHPQHSIALFNVAAAAEGVNNAWQRERSRRSALRFLSDPESWVRGWLNSAGVSRAGYLDALAAGSRTELAAIASHALAQADSAEGLEAITGRVALYNQDPALLERFLVRGRGANLHRTLRQAPQHFQPYELLAVAEIAWPRLPNTNASLAVALWGPEIATLAEGRRWLESLSVNSVVEPAVRLALQHSGSRAGGQGPSLQGAANDRLSEWVEQAPASDNTKIALGYPVPVPVDTHLPFDGFRSYAGLDQRHQELVDLHGNVHRHELGSTRANRPIAAYRLGDADLMTIDGLPESAMLTNGGIHAREWQSPEVVTGIMELLAGQQDDGHLYSYLRDNVNVVIIPVLNVDGFLQTQRYPSENWMGTDPGNPEAWPRDGRMRRKNMLQTDEDLLTQGDHLNGVDLNRNNPPRWSNDPQNSSPSPASLVHHGQSAHSEPETQALAAAAGLGPTEQLRMYTDVHSYSRVHFWPRNNNARLFIQTRNLLQFFSNHHSAFPANKFYEIRGPHNIDQGAGIGSTDEYFLNLLQAPSWTLEIEPSGNAGIDYGGLGRNGHDGFILPESEIRRVREELAQTFAISYYRQSGPPALTALRLVDRATGAVVYEAEWDVVSETTRTLHSYQAQAIQLDREYTAWGAWNKPMRWRENGEVIVLPGQQPFTLDVDADFLVDGTSLTAVVDDIGWRDQPGGAPSGYHAYRDDAVFADFRLPLNATNQGLIVGDTEVTLAVGSYDMSGLRSDADPATVSRWENGGWAGYEDSDGADLTDSGGIDTSLTFMATADALGDPFVVEAGTSSAWFDPARNGEGFVLEILDDEVAVLYWFTYDDLGRQDWYIAVGEVRGNRVLFPELLQVSGGTFGPGFDPGQVTETVVGSAKFTWSECDQGVMDWTLRAADGSVRRGRMNLSRLTRIMGIDCGQVVLPPERIEGTKSGSWYDPTHAGEGYTLEVLVDGRVLVYWFSFDAEGNRRWFFGIGEIVGPRLVFDNMLTTSGGLFGDAFDPALVTESTWGSLELELGCDGGVAYFSPTEAGFPEGQLDVVQLTSLAGLDCSDS